jgi:hypothetical protein
MKKGRIFSADLYNEERIGRKFLTNSKPTLISSNTERINPIICRKASLKAQSAMEYLMTYGWAILIIAIVLVALFSLGIFNSSNFAPKAQPGSCEVLRNSAQTSLVGQCNGMLPEYVAQFETAPAYILIVHDPYLPVLPNASRTITAWINTATYGTIFTNPKADNVNLDTCGGFNLIIDGSHPFLHDCVYDLYFSSLTINKNVWEFVAVVYSNSSDTTTVYVDNQNSTLSNKGLMQLSGNFTIGGWDTYENTMSGYISNVQFYNTSLSSSSIQALYKEGIGGAPINVNNLVGWWPLNGNANDYSGNDNNGVPTNVTYTSAWSSGYSAP